MSPASEVSQAATDPANILQQLIRFDTTNPPGNQDACIGYIRDVLAQTGIHSTVLADGSGRPNLVARIHGKGAAPPLLLQGHVDVVSTAGQEWTHPPFAGTRADEMIWGRGALDMKGTLAMFLAAVLRVAREGEPPAGDVLLAALADEEIGGEHGAQFLVRQHADHFAGVRFALGELGAFTLHVGGKRFYPIAVAEKQSVMLRATIRGPGGHGAFPQRGGTMAELARFLNRVTRHRLPVHMTAPVREMIETVAATLGGPAGLALRGLLTPALTDVALDALGTRAAIFDALLHNTVTPTVVRGGDQVNVVPSEVTVELDGRALPGFSADDLCAEVQRLVGAATGVSIARPPQGAPSPLDTALYPLLAEVIRASDQGGVPLPNVFPAVTDGRFFAELGIQSYGFTPMRLPPGFDVTKLAHAANERVPVEALTFGADAVYQVLRRFGEVAL